eukprot:CAMPEP_0194521844 /NCGR_PEP_ID=MMETSP0253-20130528/56262_1 /TAXON_ID=2966 /ORGANISM="Noctiluca scintillans" /LENGTH=408 /DNA_ID=CAMNT_0039366227 /DNA_START=72 /DNA_END=1299 /DNA_ORIENTATION=+
MSHLEGARTSSLSRRLGWVSSCVCDAGERGTHDTCFPCIPFVRNQKRPTEELSSSDHGATEINWKVYLKHCETAVLFCHGGCPDGLAASRLVQTALGQMGMKQCAIVELGHSDRACNSEGLIVPRAAVFFLDISPYPEDLAMLDRAERVIVMDHHDSVVGRMEKLAVEMPSMLDLSNRGDHHAAVSLVALHLTSFLRGVVLDLDRKVALIRKKDVWNYKICDSWAEDARHFAAFETSRRDAGGNCLMQTIDEFLGFPQRCLREGRAAAAVLEDAAEKVFSKLEKLGERDNGLSIHVAHSEDVPYNHRRLLALCTENLDPALIIVGIKKSEDRVDLQVKRTSDRVSSVGAVCRTLHWEQPKVYTNGGGHPFAAGLVVASACWNPKRVARDLIYAADVVAPVPQQLGNSE